MDALEERNPPLETNKGALGIKVVHLQGPSMDKRLTTLGGPQRSHTHFRAPSGVVGNFSPSPGIPILFAECIINVTPCVTLSERENDKETKRREFPHLTVEISLHLPFMEVMAAVRNHNWIFILFFCWLSLFFFLF